MKDRLTIRRALIALAVIVAAVFTTAGSCEGDSEFKQREQSQKAKQDPNRKTLEKANLAERIKRQEQANKIGYVYVISFAKPMGYYVIKGKVSSSGSQLTPEQDILDPCSSSYCPMAVDGPQDDGTFGQGDPGIFFFTAEGTMVETTLDYIYSDQPLDIDVPLLVK